jgi:hypothetical protein
MPTKRASSKPSPLYRLLSRASCCLPASLRASRVDAARELRVYPAELLLDKHGGDLRKLRDRDVRAGLTGFPAWP